MKFNLSWLLQYLNTNASIDAITEKLSDIGLEVESVTNNNHLADFIVVEVLEVLPHKNSQKLYICKVNCGGRELEIVCGAQNVRPKLKTVLAPVGSVIPSNNMKIEPVEIRGVLSNGMLCSYAELGLSGESSGIIELSEDYKIGSRFFADNTVIEVNITPNRGDCLGVYGIARELSAAGLGELKELDIPNIITDSKSPITIDLEVDKNCIVYGRYIENVKNTESPRWLKDFLISVGLQSISLIVDITNYIMISFNQPLHAYNANKIKNRLIVKKINNLANFVALNQKKYSSKQDITVIVDEDDVVHSIAGIIGSLDSGCYLDTNNIFLEAAWFDPIDITVASRTLGISTDASYRFARQTDPNFARQGLEIATKMILDLCGGKAYDMVVASNCTIPTKKILQFDYKTPAKIGNVNIISEYVNEVLSKLGFKIVNKNQSYCDLIIPSWRSDINFDYDIPEEVLRIYGYQHIQEQAIPIDNINNTVSIYDTLRKVLVTHGLTEIITWSFMYDKDAEIFGYCDKELILENPINENFNLMRPTLIPNLLKVLAYNITHNTSSCTSLFEIGTVFNSGESSHYELSGIRYGRNLPSNIYKIDREFDVFDVKADLINIITTYGLDENLLELKEPEKMYYHPGKAASVYYNGQLIGHFGELHPEIINHYDFTKSVMCFEAIISSIEVCTKKDQEKFVKSKYQAVKRDFAFIIDKNINVGSLCKLIKSNVALIKDIHIFDIYTGENIGSDKLSVAFSVTFRAVDHTLTDAEINTLSEEIISIVDREMNGVLRSF